MTIAMLLAGRARTPFAAALATRGLLSSRRSLSTTLKYSPAVRAALDAKKPVVALESTIITHGMPFPQNVETARMVEDLIREGGAEPATIAILDGEIHVGLTNDTLMTLGQLKRDNVTKTSRRDFAAVLARKGNGATTVSGTMLVAEKAGIEVFVTGGIGGVHRGAEESMDVSADLTELGRTPVAVVCAGVKSILDIPKTLEYLETQGVTVTTYGPRGEFPAFYTAHSGIASPNHSTTIDECAAMIYHNRALDLKSGVVIAVPIPEKDAANAGLIQAAVDTAVAEAEANGIKGKDATPFLLARVAELTRGASLAANIALIKNNARVGAKVAVELAKMRGITPAAAPTASPKATKAAKVPVVVGGLVLDVTSTLNSDVVENHSSYPGSVAQTPGGVGRNIAEAMHRVGATPTLVSAVGDDLAGQMLTSSTAALDMPTDGIAVVPGHGTAVYNALHTRSGELVTAVADMGILHRVRANAAHLDRASVVVVDGNLAPAEFARVVAAANERNVPVVFEPTSVPKSVAMPWIRDLPRDAITYATPNRVELEAMAEAWLQTNSPRAIVYDQLQLLPGCTPRAPIQATPLADLIKPATLVAHKIPRLLVKLGDDGVMYLERVSRAFRAPHQIAGNAFYQHPAWTWGAIYKGAPMEDVFLVGWSAPSRGVKVTNVTGAGDTLVGAFVAGLHAHGHEVETIPALVRNARIAAEMTLASDKAVSPSISPALMKL
ncbi:hypothetical protein H9P43_006510 [Blastocladiella emersonii ATCC 22665]|nr:hypothetical protein H9P43_006510 [Blastocladiella emersonii ATCC 22665]